jgi:hypothetical protein
MKKEMDYDFERMIATGKFLMDFATREIKG